MAHKGAVGHTGADQMLQLIFGMAEDGVSSADKEQWWKT